MTNPYHGSEVTDLADRLLGERPEVDGEEVVAPGRVWVRQASTPAAIWLLVASVGVALPRFHH